MAVIKTPVTEQELIDAQDDVRHLGEVSNSVDDLDNPIFESTSRKGKIHKTLDGLENEYLTVIGNLGYVPVAGDFDTGGTVTARNEVLLWPVASGGDGYYYKWAGALPKVVSPASTPATAGGVGAGFWTAVGGIDTGFFARLTGTLSAAQTVIATDREGGDPGGALLPDDQKVFLRHNPRIDISGGIGWTITDNYTLTLVGSPAGGETFSAEQNADDASVSGYTHRNVAELDSDDKLRLGQFVSTAGYTTARDGGGNLYEIVAAGTGTGDGGSFIDLTASGLQAKGLFPFGISVHQWGAHRITEPGYSSFDSQPAFDAMFAYLISIGVYSYKLEGTYLIDTAPYTFTTPGDDGTVYPPWVGAGDANLAAETVFNIPACFEFSQNFYIEATNPNTDGFIGTWDVATDPVDISQKILFKFTAGSKYSGTIRYALRNLRISNFFIARVGDGIVESANEDLLQIYGCGFSGLFQGVERCFTGKIEIVNCMSGDIIGGWWTQRNSTFLDSAYLPPYPATDVNALGWSDFFTTQEIIYSQYQGAFSARHESFDTFFDTYFYKDSNSARTSSGGRLSNNDAPNAAIMTAYYGVVGRARTVFSRYGRALANINIDGLKVFGSHRTPVSHYPDDSAQNINCILSNAYIERAGLVDVSTNTVSGNEFGKDYTDPYRAPGYGIGYMCANGMHVSNMTGSTGLQLAPSTNGVVKYAQAPVGVSRQLYSGTAETPSDTYLDFTEYGSSFLRRYRAKIDYFFTQPLRFETESGEDFLYKTGTFTPTLKAGGVEVPFTTKDGGYKKVGNTIFFRCALFANSDLTYSAGDITIEGLPFAIAAGGYNSAIIQTRNINGLTLGLTVGGDISGSTITFTKDSAGTHLDGTDLGVAKTTTYFEACGWYMVD